MICPKCGKENADTSKFCEGCGAPLAPAETAAPFTAPVPETPAATEQVTTPVMQETAKEPRKKKNLVPVIIIAAVALVVAIVAGILIYNSLPSTKYKKADAAFNQENYELAIKLYGEAGDYNDAADKLKQSEICLHYENAKKAIEEADYDTALSELKLTDNYSDSKELTNKCHYEKGIIAMNSGNYIDATKEFSLSNSYKDAADNIISMGEELTADGNYTDAITVFESAPNGKENGYYSYANAMLKLEVKDYAAASELFTAAGDTLDAADKYKECEYEAGKLLLDASDYKAAKTHFRNSSGYSDAASLINACDLLAAKAVMDEGKLNEALEDLKELPEGTSYKDITAADLIAKLEANQQWLDICGMWISTGGSMKTYNTTSTYQKGWYYNFQEGDEFIDITCKLLDDGSVKVEAFGFITIFTNCPEEQKDIIKTMHSVTTIESMTSLGKITIDDNTSITLKKGKITSSYLKTEKKDGKNLTYKTEVTYGKRKLAY